MKILTCLFLAFAPGAYGQAAAAAATPAPSPVPETEEWLTGSIDLGYRWQTGVGGSYQTYRSIVNLGSGPKLMGADFTITDPKKRFFDRIDVRAHDWGGDPYSTLHVNARKTRIYDLNVDYRNIAYFSNMPSFSDPLLSRGIALNEQSFDTHNRLTSVELELLPSHWFVPYLAFDRISDTGNAVNTFVSNNNEYAVPSAVRNAQNNYRGGVRLELRRFHVTVEQGGTSYKDDQRVYQSPGSTNYGNNSVPYFGQTLDLTSLLQAYGIRGNSIYSRALVTANVTPWLDVYGQFLFSQPHSSVNYQQYNTGSFVVASQLLFYTSQQYLLSAEAKLPHTTGSLGADIRPLRKVRIVQSWLTDRLHSGSSAAAVQTPLTTAALLSSSLAANYNQEQIDVIYDPTAKLTVRGGYRYVWGDANDVTLPAAGLASADHGTLRRNVGIGGITYRPLSKITLHGDIEAASSSGVYFRTSLYNYQKIRLRAAYQATPSLQFALDANLLNNQNPSPVTGGYDYLVHQESVSFIYAPAARKTWNLQGSYTRSTVRSDITYLDPGTLLPQRDLYRDNGHSATAFLDANLPYRRALPPHVSIGGSFVITSGSRPTSYFQPLAKVSLPFTRNLAWVSEWRYYGFGEAFYGYESFRTHLFTTGVRLTR